ncbi:DEKNAAC101984 [Brettanomyces naardenensis]|uniref:DEKNAAC101984 n=1 Tax=Brettanomyces naardenensis TaxID=13370 RepID=A0A448YJI0_BRENA|nr:DEKNAAC101984 [Brettanomyces naardenensis]
MMKALTYIEPGVIKYQTVEKPKLLEPTDVIGKTVLTTICGSDLHFWRGAFPETNALAKKNGTRGVILGHEGLIKVEKVGPEVKNFKPGDICIVSCVSSCGHCYYCEEGCEAHCAENGGDCGCILGHEIDGTQAEYIRVPLADTSLYKCPEGIPLESLLMLSDILPTSYELGVRDGGVKEGSTVAIVGLGPIGLAALLSAKALKPAYIVAIDLDDTRLELAKKLGADYTINPKKEDPVSFVMKLPINRKGKQPGVDTAIECVGSPTTFELCQKLVGMNGIIANVGVHSKPTNLEMERLWIMNIKITTGLVNTNSTPELLKKVVDGDLDPSPLITHHFKLSEVEKAYEVFKNASESHAIKIVLTPD